MQLVSGNTNAVASLRRKYNSLLGVALTLQNLLDDVATQLERLHACITWQDPSATLLFIAFCAGAAMALALLGLPIVMASGFFWLVSPCPPPPSPTPSYPLPSSHLQHCLLLHWMLLLLLPLLSCVIVCKPQAASVMLHVADLPVVLSLLSSHSC